ncbi:hypothetical protein [Paraburkholderia guartelaensis]|uniref:Uncharacterized protein n=1 Tax=Paraburkholderia guartelaensis TaxID=2546446 RepID=A0ABU9SHM4_9BURK
MSSRVSPTVSDLGSQPACRARCLLLSEAPAQSPDRFASTKYRRGKRLLQSRCRKFAHRLREDCNAIAAVSPARQAGMESVVRASLHRRKTHRGSFGKALRKRYPA